VIVSICLFNRITTATFYSRAIKSCNELPLSIKESKSLGGFKQNLKKHYLELQKQRLNV